AIAAGDGDKLYVAASALDKPDQLESIAIRHEDVGDDEIDGFAFQYRDRNIGTAGLDDLVAADTQYRGDDFALGFPVVDENDLCDGGPSRRPPHLPTSDGGMTRRTWPGQATSALSTPARSRFACVINRSSAARSGCRADFAETSIESAIA